MSVQDVLDGILQGGLYAIVALGLSLVFGVLRLVNLAHGELLVGGGYLAYFIQHEAGIDPLLSLLIVVPVAFVLAYPIQRYLLTDLMRRSEDVPLVATFGLSLVLSALFAEAFTADGKSIEAAYATSGISFVGLRVQSIDVIAFGLAVALIAATHLVLTRTRAGIEVRAAAADPDTAATMGLDVRRIYAVTFGIAAAMAASAGVIVGLGVALTPTSGLGWLVTGFAVVVLGGLGSVTGTLVAGLALGIVEAVGGQVFGTQYGDLVVYGTFFLALAVRPTGLMRSQLA
jgi:branched-chain amino acid transport system permease protein